MPIQKENFNHCYKRCQIICKLQMVRVLYIHLYIFGQDILKALFKTDQTTLRYSIISKTIQIRYI